MSDCSSSQWLNFTKEELASLPSNRDGISVKEDAEIRKKVGAFMQELGVKLKVPQLTIATAIVLFHRFFVRYSMKKFDPFDIACACMFLGGKAEETPRKLRDVLQVGHHVRSKTTEPLDENGKEFLELRDRLLINERILMTTVCFDLTIDHPYRHLLSYAKELKGTKELAQYAWNFVNDSLRTTLSLQYPPQQIAVTALYLASKFKRHAFEDFEGKPWWERYKTSIETIEDIANQILDLYESRMPMLANGEPEAGGLVEEKSPVVPTVVAAPMTESSAQKEGLPSKKRLSPFEDLSVKRREPELQTNHANDGRAVSRAVGVGFTHQSAVPGFHTVPSQIGFN